MRWEDVLPIAQSIDVPIHHMMAVIQVESNGEAFDPDGFPVTLLEAHWFGRLTHWKYNDTHPNLSTLKWDRTTYGKTRTAERARLDAAVKLDREAALKSTSFGMFQILGLNHRECGHPTVQSFVNAQCRSEEAQVECFVAFIKSKKLVEHLKNGNWESFAKTYNGPSYAQNKYDTKMEAAALKWAKHIVVNKIASR